MTDPSSSDAGCCLTRLPVELRVLIYEQLIVRPTQSKHKRAYKQILPLLRTCKLINQEAEPIIYSENNFRVTLSVRGGYGQSPMIHVKIFLGDRLYSNVAYQRGYIYQTSAWAGALRKAPCVKIAIELGMTSLLLNRLAINHALASLLFYLDAASDIKKLQIRLLRPHSCSSEELLEILQPLRVWSRCTTNVVIDPLRELKPLRTALLYDVGKSCEEGDLLLERLFSLARMAARAFDRLKRGGWLVMIVSLNKHMAEILTEVGFVGGPACPAKAETAIVKLEVLLTRVLDGI